MLHHLSGGAWDPHDVNAVALTSDSAIQLWDLRTMKYALILGLTINIFSSSLCVCLR